ncbi:MAG: 6-carboxytetrahydropterin synthase QueD [Raoultibacter sp.]
MIQALLHTDGGSRGNPGIAGFGFDLVSPEGTLIADGGWFLPRATNNVAEYSALVWGLKNALAAGVTHIQVRADSELMVKQMLGQYKVKSEDLKPLFIQAKELFGCFTEAGIAHVYRNENKRADALANETMDAQSPVGSYLVAWEETPTNLFDFGVETAPLSSSEEPTKSESRSAATPGSFDALFEHTQRKDVGLERNPVYAGKGALSGETYEHTGGTYELTVKDHFDAAHALPGYDGPCRYLHGHTWDVEATIVGQHLDDVGILYDFKDIKRDLHAILENFDHRYINDVKPFDVLNPTAEHMARIIFFELEKTLPSWISLKEIAVWESPQARVAYRL